MFVKFEVNVFNFHFVSIIIILVDIMEKQQRTSIILKLFLTLSFLVFSSLSPFGHFHEHSHSEFEHAEFHLHVTHADDKGCASANKEQSIDDHHWFELSYEVVNYSCLPTLHQGYTLDNLLKHISQQYPICSTMIDSFVIPLHIVKCERGSPVEVLYSQISPHFFTNLSPPLG